VLSRWLSRPVHLDVSVVEQVSLEEASEVLGPGETLLAACEMEMHGTLDGNLLFVFEERSGLALADMLLGQAPGTTTAWGELEQSAAMETANLVGCAYLNSLAAHLPIIDAKPASLVPGPPSFRVEFAASLLEFVLMEQAITGDRLLLVKNRFTAERAALDWSLLFVPGASAFGGLLAGLASSEVEH
jgi:chemotaxis protein CheC